MPQLPFSIFKRKGRRFYYVQFKSKKGGYLPAVSTKQLTEAAAIETAFLWLREGHVKISNSIIEERNLSAGRKNKIMRADIIPLRWAFTKEFILKNVATGITWFSEKSAKKHILSPEIVQAIFNVEWSDIRSYLANLLASLTGLRAGEIQGLRVQDLGKECLYIKHSWNGVDKLKPTKNNEIRTVELPFPNVIKALLNLAARNPHGANMDSFVFWAEKSPFKPMEGHLFVKGLRKALIIVGMSKESAASYVFHGWRHYFTSYMISKLEKKLLKSQTGHKTDAMLNLYGAHWTEGDREKIRQAQQEVFGALVPTQSLVPLLQAG